MTHSYAQLKTEHLSVHSATVNLIKDLEEKI